MSDQPKKEVVGPNVVLKQSIEPPPCIRLGGEDWPIPKLAPRQNRIIVPRIMRTAPKVLALRIASQMLGTTGSSKDLDVFEKYAAGLSEQVYADLLEVTYTALLRAHPDLSRDQFDDMPIGTDELMKGIDTISEQTGMFKRKAPATDPLADRGAGETQNPLIATSPPTLTS